ADCGRSRRSLRRVSQMTWPGILVASAACYALKLAGLSLPQRWLQNPRVQRTVPLIPIALLAALVATQTFATGQHLVLDVRAAALAVAVVAVILRAPFLVVIVLAAATAALLRLLCARRPCGRTATSSCSGPARPSRSWAHACPRSHIHCSCSRWRDLPRRPASSGSSAP